jgi:multidrug efflux pump
MTSLAFILGTLPLAIASGAGSASQRAIGTAVIGGMITAVALAVLFVPAFFVVVRAVFKKSKVKPHRGAPLGHDTPPAPAQEGA